MIVPAILFVTSVAIGAYLVLGGVPDASILLPISGLSTLVTLVLLVRGWFDTRRNWIVLDGSNIMHWKAGAPQLDTVRTVADWLKEKGYEPVIWFDANVGYKIGDRYLGPEELARKLDRSRKRIFVAPKGKPADTLLLKHAVRMKARVVSNDRFRDWETSFPRLKDDNFLVRTELDGGNLILKL